VSPDRWEQVEELFAAALERPLEQRAGYVAAATADPVLSEDVLSLLEAHEGRGRLDSIADQLHGLRPAAAVVPVAELLARLRSALDGRYEVERELGRGGMAIVLLAHDLKHHRKVAIKVLQPDLARDIGPARFLQEIAIAAQLAHPHILPLHDSGEADGLLYYIMPYVEGESLRDRLRREGRLPLADALQIAGQVAGALSYAHARSVIHRDIKPENILLEAGHAVVSDFGIARAMTAAGGGELAETGVVLGTPAYMSPEQAVAPDVDGRSDVYSLGCVLYEMLVGEPPFLGATAESVLRRHRMEDPMPLRAGGVTVPEGVSVAIERALAKQAADRFATAAEFANALTVAPEAHAPFRLSAGLTSIAATLVVGLVAAGVWWRSHPAAVRLEPDVVAVLPFRVAGGDPALRFLREGMVDLLATRLTGEHGSLRARDPGTVLSAWRRSVNDTREDLDERGAVELARRLGAGRVLLGNAVRTSEKLVVSALLLGVPDGRRRAAASVEGSPDSLATHIDHLVAQLLAREAGESGPRLATLTTTSLPALQAYLAGKAAVRRGRLREATDAFDNALQLDSTFALAAMDLAWWSVWVEQGERLRRARMLAWQYRDRLTARDQILLLPRLFGDYPSSTGSAHSQRAVLRDWENAVAAAPDRAEEWFGYGNALFLFGHMLGLQAPGERAAAAYRRALGLDSTFALAVYRLGDLAVFAGDSMEARRLLARYVALDSVSEHVDALRWRVAARFGDSAERAQVRARLPEMPRASLHRIVGNAQLDGIGLDDAERAAELLQRGAGTRAEQRNTLLRLHNFALNRGRPRAALALARAVGEVELVPGAELVVNIADALFWDGDSNAAGKAARDLAALYGARSRASGDDRVRTGAICAAALWGLAHGDPGNARQALIQLRAIAGPANSREAVALSERCAPILAAELAELERGPAAAAALERLDSLAALGGAGAFAFTQAWQRFLNLVVARRHEARGDLAGALAAVRRRAAFDANQGGTSYLSTYLREEGRLAALVGDREGAVRAYRHYLALRSDPEPSLRPEVDRVRAALARLEEEGAD